MELHHVRSGSLSACFFYLVLKSLNTDSAKCTKQCKLTSLNHSHFMNLNGTKAVQRCQFLKMLVGANIQFMIFIPFLPVNAVGVMLKVKIIGGRRPRAAPKVGI